MIKPIIAITMGDPAGVGPEIIVKALRRAEIYQCCRPLVIGERGSLQRALEIIHKGAMLHVVEEPGQGYFQPGTIDLIDFKNIDHQKFYLGKIQKSGGRAAYAYIKKATRLAVAKQVDALVTAPIHKEALKAADVEESGHTEILGKLCGIEEPMTMFMVRNLRIFFLSRHVSLRKACELVKKRAVFNFVRRCIQMLEILGVPHHKFAVAGLNPHCGEQGLFGQEEIRELIPAIESLKQSGLNIIGPVSADAVFYQALQHKWDGVLALYHDQGHIAAKTLDFKRTISLTLGLPFLRASVDHGTAFDIAGKGIAQATSLQVAIMSAARYAVNYRTNFQQK